MNPDKLFDYLDGKLSAAERAELEQQLARDPHLQRELAVARQIHNEMPDSREIFAPNQPRSTMGPAGTEGQSSRGAVLGRRIAIAFAVLVFANVVFGIYAIAFMEKKRRAGTSEGQNRKQLAQTVERAAASALPTPSMDVEEIKFVVPATEQDAVANKVIVAAQQCSGSGTKGLASEHGILVFVEVPTARLHDFQETLRKLGAVLPAQSSAGLTSEKSIVQVRITDLAKP